MPIDVVTVRGTGEPFNGPDNMLTFVTRSLDSAKYHVVGDVSFPAAVGPVNQGWNVAGQSADASVRIGVDNLAQAIRSSANKVGVLGYSLGALVVTAFLEAQATGQYPDCELAWSACVANPRRRAGESIDPNPSGYGIDGQRSLIPPGAPHYEVANPADVITSSPVDSPLRTLADGISAFSLADVGGWTMDVVDKLRERKFQPASLEWWLHPIATVRAYEAAAVGMEGFLSGQTHIRDYIEGGYCDRLAVVLNSL